MKKKIFFLSASDRINYGDLLFPIIFLKVLKQKKIDVEFNNYSLIKSDLSFFGGIKTNSYKKLIIDLKKNKNSILIIGGGEIFFPNWIKLYSYISPIYNRIQKIKFFIKFESKIKFFIKRIYAISSDYPFTPSKINGEVIIYNSVGGSFLNTVLAKDIPMLISNLMNSDYVSVRDIDSHENLEKNGINNLLVPDSALIMSDFFSKEYLRNNFSQKKFNKNSKYIYLQLGKNKNPNIEDQFYCQLLNFSRNNNYDIILCPIGLAEGHEDDKILIEISKKYGLKYINPKNVFEIMFLISNSEIYLGTSLHGLITAQSFGVKFIPLNSNIEKLNRYCKTWFNEIGIIKSFNFNEWEKIEKFINEWNYDKISLITEQSKNKIYINFDEIFYKYIENI